MLVAVNRENLRFEVQAQYAGVDDSKHYVAVGLSKDPKMGDDAVVGCYGQKVAQYWNTGTYVVAHVQLDQNCKQTAVIFLKI